ncbi:MAG: hypothetical protein HY332_22020 [Chloroflexi bacterium]|nr:hypothetical protein [Chloroflexota bacterium]
MKDGSKPSAGERAVTAAVLAGVYKLRNLEDAQVVGVILFWEYDLAPLAEFLKATA